MSEHRQESLRASAHVTNAISRGDMNRASAHSCADCGNQARDWDHRDYLRPLEVDPLCRSCNIKRGCAYDSKFRPAGEVDAPPAFVPVDGRKSRWAVLRATDAAPSKQEAGA